MPARPSDMEANNPEAHFECVLEEIERAIRSVAYGSVEVIIQNSRVVQIERKEKFRFNGS
jgi:hypothetical protein